MLKKIKGNILDLKCDAVVVPVNTKGIAGAGLAEQFKQRYPENYKLYKEYCDNELLQPGKLFVTNNIGPYKYIINCATKDHWMYKSEYIWVEDCIREIDYFMEMVNIKSLAISYIGAGYGGLQKESVHDMMEMYFTKKNRIILVDR